MEEGEVNYPWTMRHRQAPFFFGWTAAAAVAQCWECTVGVGGDAALRLLPILGGGSGEEELAAYIYIVFTCIYQTPELDAARNIIDAPRILASPSRNYAQQESWREKEEEMHIRETA